jgi:hypothetical protein
MRIFFLSVFTLLVSIGYSQQDTSNVVPTKDTAVFENILVPDFTANADALENEMESQDVSGLLQSSRDVFNGTAGFNFIAARYRIRGYNADNFVVMMNGVKLNDLESGWAVWANWGGLNDITRFQVVKNGLAPSQQNFGGLGSTSNIEARASQIRSGTRVSYAMSNRSFNHRLMFTHATGLMENGWAVAFSGSYRGANEGYVEGTHFSGGSYFLAVEKKLNDRHSVGFVGFGSPTVQGRASIAVQEAYDLTGNNYYNPFWGYQTDPETGEKVKRNSRVRNNHRPLMMINHVFDVNKKTQITNSVYYQFGKSANTGLNWYDAPDPRPDYYRYLPSYYTGRDDDFTASLLENEWRTNDDVRQINWDQLYFANSKNNFTVENANGVAGERFVGNRAKYIVEEYRQDPQLLGFNTNIVSKVKDNLVVSGALNYNNYKSKNYKIMKDLLGADFWLDVNQFAERDADDPSQAQNDLNNPNNIIEQGDRFGYDYDININKGELFLQAEYSTKKIDFFLSGTASATSFWRTGHMQTGTFPDNSFGDSEKQKYINGGVKGGFVYKITGRHFVSVNSAFITRAPNVFNAYISPRTRDFLVEGLRSEEIITGDINYNIKYPGLRARISYFYTEFKHQTWNRSFYHDEYRNFVNYMMNGVNRLSHGLEIGVEKNVTQTIIANMAFGKMQNTYNSRPTATLVRDNSTEIIDDGRTVYIENYKVGGAPQTVLTGGLKYNSPKFWYLGANANYFADMYIEPNPDRRTEEALEGYIVDDPQWQQVIGQTKLENGYTIDAYFGKSWRVKWGGEVYFINLNLSVNNLLNNTNFQAGGFEQLRYDAKNIDRFPNKNSYMYGITYFAMLSVRF